MPIQGWGVMLSQGPTEYYIKLKIANKKYKAFENKKTTGFSDEIKINRFLVCGSGGSGTSLLRGLLNAHSKLTVLFENMRSDQWDGMADAANKLNAIWGNKINVQKCNSNKITDKMILNFAEKYHMIWIVRRPAHFDWKLKKAYRTVWNRINQLYLAIVRREEHEDLKQLLKNMDARVQKLEKKEAGTFKPEKMEYESV